MIREDDESGPDDERRESSKEGGSGGFQSVGSGDIADELDRGVPGDVPTRAIRPRAETPPVAVQDVRIGRTLVGRYRIEKLIGKGGMGRVYIATQLPLNREVAVKILNPEFQRKDPQFAKRFFLEAATAAQLNHPNTITVFDYGETEHGELFIAMELLKGRPLSRVISRDGPMNAERTITVSTQIVRALREAHAKGIIHRDLKPGNIMLLEEAEDRDIAKVLDFGLVKLFRTDESNHDKMLAELTPNPNEGDELTRAGMFLGSPKYMSPEQIQGQKLDPRTDIYSLGVIMFQMLAGRVPFRGSTSVEIIYKHVNQPIPSIHSVNPEADAPPELERVVHRCLEKNRDRRYGSMAELLQDLKDVRRLISGSTSASGSSVGLEGSLASVSLAARNPLDSMPPPARPTVSTPTPPVPDPVFEAKKPSLPPIEPSKVPGARRAELVRLGTAGFAAVVVVLLGVITYELASPPAPIPPEDATPKPTTELAPPPRAVEPVPAPAPVVPPPPPAAPVETTVAFGSKPPGAEVYAGDTLLGRTPFERALPAKADGPQRFAFEKDGFLDEVVEERIEGDRVRIFATLRPVPKRMPAPPRRAAPRPAAPKPKPGNDFKDNPY